MAAAVLDRPTHALVIRYRVEKELGAGDMASAHLAGDRKHEREVTINTLHADLRAVLGREQFLAENTKTVRLHPPPVLPLLEDAEAEPVPCHEVPRVRREMPRTRPRIHARRAPIPRAVRTPTPAQLVAAMHIVLEQVAAYNARDIDRFLATYHPETVITLADGMEMMRGHAAMRALYSQLFAQSPMLQCDVSETMDLGRFMVVRERVTGMQLEGFPESLDVGVVYTVDNGLITRVQFLM